MQNGFALILLGFANFLLVNYFHPPALACLFLAMLAILLQSSVRRENVN